MRDQIMPRAVWAPQSVIQFAAREPRMSAAVVILLLCVLVTSVAMVFDARQINGVSVWVKPLKFEWAFIAYLGTLVWFAHYLPDPLVQTRRYRLFSGAIVGAVALELLWIGGAAANGVASHFNLDGAMGAVYGLMGALAVILLSGSLVYGIVFWRDHSVALLPAARLSLALGLLLTFVLTLGVAGYMSSAMTHWVGGKPSDSEGLALMGWARDGGDLRVAHFFATHAMHLIPLVGYAAARLLSESRARLVVWFFATAYSAGVAYTFWQALSGRPFGA